MSGSGTGTPAAATGYVAPTPTELKARHTAFAAVADAIVLAAIVDANRHVDSSWLVSDYKSAIMLLAAHMMVTEGALNPDGAAVQAVVSGPIQSESLGDASVSYAASNVSSGMSAEESELMSTVYGRRFAALRRANLGPAVMVVS